MNRDFFIKKYFNFPFSKIVSLLNTNNAFCEFDFDQIFLSLSENRKDIQVSERVIKYSCRTDIGDVDNQKENIIIICIKDNNHLLNFCLDNIYQNNIDQYCDILVIDDRPLSSDNHFLCLNKKITYCQINNTDDTFNYSIINNIGASYAKLFDKKRILFWNSDLWTDNPNTLKNILKAHIDKNSTITGTKLIYPNQSDYQNLRVQEHVLGKHLANSYGTIQHGGIIFIPSPCLVNPKSLMFMPSHQWRFYQQDHSLASIDQRCFAVTGALHIINIKDFLDLGGYGCCLASSYQDIDLCQRAVQKQMPVYYIGSEFMFHAETITNVDGQNINNSKLYQSDRLVYEYIWQPQIQKILGMSK
jgi:hypothetical protein